ncbi:MULTISPECIES: hypothetical protein [unclassified Corynebacterium]|uniref:hypothetical protein n=1 Tax=unclassified Corynebacterium TaxID=2624378 RepID=UPI0030984861
MIIRRFDDDFDPNNPDSEDHPRGESDDNFFSKYKLIWAVLITLITLLSCWQLFQVVLAS